MEGYIVFGQVSGDMREVVNYHVRKTELADTAHLDDIARAVRVCGCQQEMSRWPIPEGMGHLDIRGPSSTVTNQCA